MGTGKIEYVSAQARQKAGNQEFFVFSDALSISPASEGERELHNNFKCSFVTHWHTQELGAFLYSHYNGHVLLSMLVFELLNVQFVFCRECIQFE